MVAVGRWKRRGDRVVALRRGVESSVCRRDSGAAVTVVVGGTLGRVIGWCVRGRRHVMDGMGRGTLGQSGGGLQINGGLIFDFLGGGGAFDSRAPYANHLQARRGGMLVCGAVVSAARGQIHTARELQLAT